MSNSKAPASMATLFLEAEAESDRLETSLAKAEQKAANLAEELADAQGELRAERRTVAMLEEALKAKNAEHAETERRFAATVAQMSALNAAEDKSEAPGWILEVLGRDGNNDLHRMRISADKGRS